MRTVTPSGQLEDDVRPAATGGNAQGLLRGLLVHRLMQSLPDIAAERRRQAANDFVLRADRDNKLSSEERSKLVDQVVALLADPRFNDLFGPGSRAEVPIVGRLKTATPTLKVAGQVDRLIVTPTSVLIADFKTNRPAPRNLEEVPSSYVRPLALYRAVLGNLYQDRSIRAALIWTEVPDLMEVSDDTLDHALALVTSPR
jgi:ATP-dependent helicase/nuclease subunit A